MDADETGGPSGVGYPARLDVEYPEAGLSRVKTFFRLVLVIPIVVIMSLLGQGSTSFLDIDWRQWGLDTVPWLLIAPTLTGGGLLLPTVLVLLFRRKYPRWWFDWNLELARFTTRVGVYLSLMRDEYPSTDEQQAVALDLDYPDASRDLSRWLPLVKWILALPHYIVLAVLSVAALVCEVLAWFAILFTGRYPRGLFGFVLGVHRWALRVSAYVGLLITDRYPPFSLR